MPLIVKDYTWTQTPTALHIRIPVNPVHHDDVDLFATDSYIKANYSPFLFEVFLLHEVIDSSGKCIVKDDLITMDFTKKEELVWEKLEKDLSKEQKKILRQEILEKCQEKAKLESEEKAVKISQMSRFAVQRAMEIDNKQHELMESRKDAERKKAMDVLEEWRVNKVNEQIQDIKQDFKSICLNNSYNRQTNHGSGVKIVEMPSSDEDDENGKKLKEQRKVKKYKQLNKTPKKPIKTPVKSEFIEKKKEEVSKRVLPKLRQMGQLEITHTPRTFTTPSRESTAQEEEIWLKNVTLARRATGFVSEDLRPEEQDPQWCKNKGDEFFRDGNFLGAISAYTHGILLSDKLPTLFANRAAAHFALGNFNKCMNDCSTALDLMKPECESNRRSRAKCIARRAAALARLGYLNKAIGEMKAAAKLLPDDEQIKKDIYDMERAWEQDPDSD